MPFNCAHPSSAEEPRMVWGVAGIPASTESNVTAWTGLFWKILGTSWRPGVWADGSEVICLSPSSRASSSLIFWRTSPLFSWAIFGIREIQWFNSINTVYKRRKVLVLLFIFLFVCWFWKKICYLLTTHTSHSDRRCCWCNRNWKTMLRNWISQ